MLQQSLQSIHFRYFTGKVFFLKGLWIKCESPAFLPGFFLTVSSIADWVKLPATRMLLILRWMLGLGLDKVFGVAGPERFGWGGNPRDRAFARSLNLGA
jgi:hypothetical protein